MRPPDLEQNPAEHGRYAKTRSFELILKDKGSKEGDLCRLILLKENWRCVDAGGKRKARESDKKGTDP